MRTGLAVIGANYGDEGKGLVTDFLSCRMQEDCTVVRFNGGAQAGHTVVTAAGQRHVFSHFGAGSFSHCPTHLSQFFVVNPRLFVRELAELQKLGLTPKVTIDARAFLSTPLDVLVNQAIEQKRGLSRHGSCGVGINETVTRCLRADHFRTQVQDLLNPYLLRQKLRRLARDWLPVRLLEHGIASADTELEQMIDKIEPMISVFIDECESILENAELGFRPPQSKHIVFEGAQGLMLDEHRLDQYPHLTRSKTGLENVAFLCHRYGIDALKVIYVTRTYLTRHGAGPLSGECGWHFHDSTNVPNPYQGELRFAPLNIENLAYSIDLDLKRGKYLFDNLSANLAVTCLDQHPLPDLSAIQLPVCLCSHGPSRQDIDCSFSEKWQFSVVRPFQALPI